MANNRMLIKQYKEVNTGEVSLPICFSYADGAYLYDHDGNGYLDFTSGYGVTSSGWLRKEIADVVQQQLQRSAFAPPWLPTREAIGLSELLLSITPANLTKCARATGGADANEVIFKAIYASSGKNGIVAFNRSYHGGTHFALNISDTKTFGLPRLPSGAEYNFVDTPYYYRRPGEQSRKDYDNECITTIERLMQKKKNIGALYIEPVTGSGGVIIPSKQYLHMLRELCDRYGVFLVFDEVLTGFGRLGAITASRLFDIQPDAISLAKGMSAGYTAIGAALLNEELANGIKAHEDVSASFAWTPLSCTIAKANIELIINENLSQNAACLGRLLISKLQKLFQHYLPDQTGEIRGMGLMIGIELVIDQLSKVPDKKLMQKFVITALRQGLMICASWDFQAIILMPPLNITEEEVNEGIKKIECILKCLTRNSKLVEFPAINKISVQPR